MALDLDEVGDLLEHLVGDLDRAAVDLVVALRLDQRDELVHHRYVRAFEERLAQEARARDADFEELFPHEWHWDAPEQVDPVKEATAQQTRLTAKTTTYARELANDGHDWREHFEQLARERDLAKQLGLELTAPNQPGALVPAGPLEEDDDPKPQNEDE